MSKNNNEIRDLLAQLALGEDQVRATIEDIQQGDDLMHRHNQLQVDPAILARAKTRVRQEPDSGENQPQDKELYDLLMKHNMSENQAQAAVDDIRRGDDLMCRHDRLQVDPTILARTKARVRQEPDRSQRRRTGYDWGQRTAVQAAALIIAMGLIIYLMPQKTFGPHPNEDTSAYWYQVLVQENEFDQEINDMFLSEVLKCWSEVEWKVDDILGPDTDSEPNPIDVSRIVWIGHQLCE